MHTSFAQNKARIQEIITHLFSLWFKTSWVPPGGPPFFKQTTHHRNSSQVKEMRFTFNTIQPCWQKKHDICRGSQPEVSNGFYGFLVGSGADIGFMDLFLSLEEKLLLSLLQLCLHGQRPRSTSQNCACLPEGTSIIFRHQMEVGFKLCFDIAPYRKMKHDKMRWDTLPWDKQ